MAIVCTDRGTHYVVSSNDDLIIPSFTPSANCLLLLAYAGTNIPVNTPSSAHGTWVQIGSRAEKTNKDLELWGCLPGASPATGAVTVATSYHVLSVAICMEVTGVDVSGTVANALTDYNVALDYTSNPPTQTLTADEITFTMIYRDGTNDITGEGTGVCDSGTGAGIRLESFYQDPGDSSPTYVGGNGTYWGIASGTFKAASASNIEIAVPTGPVW